MEHQEICDLSVIRRLHSTIKISFRRIVELIMMTKYQLLSKLIQILLKIVR